MQRIWPLLPTRRRWFGRALRWWIIWVFLFPKRLIPQILQHDSTRWEWALSTVLLRIGKTIRWISSNWWLKPNCPTRCNIDRFRWWELRQRRHIRRPTLSMRLWIMELISKRWPRNTDRRVKRRGSQPVNTKTHRQWIKIPKSILQVLTLCLWMPLKTLRWHRETSSCRCSTAREWSINMMRRWLRKR